MTEALRDGPPPRQPWWGWLLLALGVPLAIGFPVWVVFSGFFQQAIDPEHQPGFDWLAAAFGAWVAVVVLFAVVAVVLTGSVVAGGLWTRRARRVAGRRYREVSADGGTLPADAWSEE